MTSVTPGSAYASHFGHPGGQSYGDHPATPAAWSEQYNHSLMPVQTPSGFQSHRLPEQSLQASNFAAQTNSVQSETTYAALFDANVASQGCYFDWAAVSLLTQMVSSVARLTVWNMQVAQAASNETASQRTSGAIEPNSPANAQATTAMRIRKVSEGEARRLAMQEKRQELSKRLAELEGEIRHEKLMVMLRSTKEPGQRAKMQHNLQELNARLEEIKPMVNMNGDSNYRGTEDYIPLDQDDDQGDDQDDDCG